MVTIAIRKNNSITKSVGPVSIHIITCARSTAYNAMMSDLCVFLEIRYIYSSITPSISICIIIAHIPKSSIAGPNIIDVVECAYPKTVDPTITRGSVDFKNPVRVLYMRSP